MNDVIAHKLLSAMFIDSDTLLEETDYLFILGQIPWNDLMKCTADEVHQHVLYPIQRAIEKLAAKSYVRLIITLGKIVVVMGIFSGIYSLICRSFVVHFLL